MCKNFGRVRVFAVIVDNTSLPIFIHALPSYIYPLELFCNIIYTGIIDLAFINFYTRI